MRAFTRQRPFVPSTLFISTLAAALFCQSTTAFPVRTSSRECRCLAVSSDGDDVGMVTSDALDLRLQDACLDLLHFSTVGDDFQNDDDRKYSDILKGLLKGDGVPQPAPPDVLEAFAPHNIEGVSSVAREQELLVTGSGGSRMYCRPVQADYYRENVETSSIFCLESFIPIPIVLGVLALGLLYERFSESIRERRSRSPSNATDDSRSAVDEKVAVCSQYPVRKSTTNPYTYDKYDDGPVM
ncbi:hypothetical protein BDY21DRAFT_369343 [Lineolata rhizophorae]|uniref:Uncharacterized protein n=1 Tax=Lineolata rhizophorae TaxID=578093 RepID=A0A6A6P8M9_9PEZI|nr:hypothetical protein BDY21DRAFT_369343 [Lineolata rhizophorae]